MKITNYFVEQLPRDKKVENYPRKVHNSCYSIVYPIPTKKSKLIHYNKEVLKLIGLEKITQTELKNFVTGNTIPKESKPFAMCYGGHQFGNWAGQLGDGRAINIAEIEHNDKINYVQLKGAGPTPYSRGADGFAVLRSSIREYLCSEAVYNLGIPTTRALSLSLSGNMVVRDIMYDGNPKKELGAIVARVAPSFIRFGNFEIFAARRDIINLKKIADFTIQQNFNHINNIKNNIYLEFFKEVTKLTKNLIINWQRVGFVHGVMNTDNFSILGLTIDYGPYGWLEDYNPQWTPNTTDSNTLRYCYGNQYIMSLWALNKLANALFPLIKDEKEIINILKKYRQEFNEEHTIMLLSKLGIKKQEENDESLIEELLNLLEISSIDMTLFFRNLNKLNRKNKLEHLKIIEKDSYLTSSMFKKYKKKWLKWLELYSKRIESINEIERVKIINKTNPKYIIRNYMVQLAIEEAEKGNYKLIEELFELSKQPYNEQPKYEKWFSKRPLWAENKIGCSMLSCSS